MFHLGETDSLIGVRQTGMVRGARQGRLGMRVMDVVSDRENLSAHLWSGLAGAGFIV